MPTPINIADALLEEHINELVDLKARIEPDLARIAELEKYLKGLEPGKYSTGAVDLTVSPQSRFDKKKFAEAFPAAEYPHFYKTPAPEPDTRQITPALKEKFSTAYDNRIKIS